MDTPGIARAINELGLKGKVFVVGTGMPNECRSLIKDGSLSYITLWDPAEAGYAMCVMARQILEGKQMQEGTDLGLKSYSKLVQSKDNPHLFMYEGISNFYRQIIWGALLIFVLIYNYIVNEREKKKAMKG